jgi:hypothetical protein
MASFGEGFAAGQQMAAAFRQRKFEQSIDDAGKSVTEEMQKEKDFERSQRQLVDNARANNAMAVEPVNPSIYQQGDSLGLQGYQTGNKPIQTTMPIAPPGYMSRPGEEVTPGIDTNGYYEPEPNTSANPATAQTLIGNYGTTASFKGEKPTREDSLMMQKDTQRPYSGPQDNTILDLAQIKPDTPPQEAAKPKILDTLNEQVTTSTRAKEIYDYNTRVIQKLQQGGNARAALEFQGKVATAELTLAQADHAKSTTMAALGKEVGGLASNALEAMQQPGADINKIFYDTMENAKVNLGYSGKIPFSMDPNENIKTLQLIAKNAISVETKAELGIKQAVASQKSVMDNAELAIKQDKLTLEKFNTGLAVTKELREQGTAAFNRLTENTKLQFQALNSVNSVMNEDYKKALRPAYDANLKTLQDYSKVLNVPMPNIAANTPGNVFAAGKTQPGTAPNPAIANPSPNTQPVNDAFPADVLQDAGVASEAGGYVPPTPKTPAQVAQDAKTRAATKENIKTQIKELKASTDRVDVRIGKPLAKSLKTAGKETVKVLGETGKSIKEWAAGKDEAEINAKIAELQKQLDALK